MACLTQVRNAARQVPAWLEHAAAFCDAVVALDHGSTDATAGLLAAHPLVRSVIRDGQPSVSVAANDAEHRNRLLAAAVDLDPEWVLFLDADERIEPTDAAALRAFVDTDALPGCAYGIRLFRMVDDQGSFDPEFALSPRLFAFVRGQRVPHDDTAGGVPAGLARVPTNLRIQYLAPRADGADFVDGARPPARWAPRPLDLPVLDAALLDAPDLSSFNLEGSLVSAVVVASDREDTPDEATIRSLLAQQSCDPVVVVIVATGAGIAARLARAFPQLRLIECDSRGSPGAARNAGLAEVTGDSVLFVETCGVFDATTAARAVIGHERGDAMVTGEVRPPAPSPWALAGYFLDHAASLPHGRLGRLDIAPSCCSYARGPLMEIGGFPTGVDELDSVVTAELLRRGHTVWRDPELCLGATIPDRSGSGFLHGRVRRGRAVGRGVGRPPVSFAQARRHALHADEALALEFRRIAPFAAAGALASRVGFGFERARAVARRAARRAMTSP